MIHCASLLFPLLPRSFHFQMPMLNSLLPNSLWVILSCRFSRSQLELPLWFRLMHTPHFRTEDLVTWILDWIAQHKPGSMDYNNFMTKTLYLRLSILERRIPPLCFFPRVPVFLCLGFFKIFITWFKCLRAESVTSASTSDPHHKNLQQWHWIVICARKA